MDASELEKLQQELAEAQAALWTTYHAHQT